ncbi:MAG: hypothetical protein QOF52_1979 [Propionibacteriaceae bacterium]|jgi:hypothetical protein|nr:hypothetical protein [Propionibacteriaceae bacterium]MDX6322121.1 hypothetical protein [Propionibacteriaceae bacterium]
MGWGSPGGLMGGPGSGVGMGSGPGGTGRGSVGGIVMVSSLAYLDTPTAGPYSSTPESALAYC